MGDLIQVDEVFLDGAGQVVNLIDVEGRVLNITKSTATLISHELGDQHWVITHYVA